jgi:hypothetical protein
VSVGVAHVVIGDPVLASALQDHWIHTRQLTLITNVGGDRLDAPFIYT